MKVSQVIVQYQLKTKSEAEFFDCGNALKLLPTM